MKCLPHHADTYRPSGALRHLGIAFSINMSPLLGLKGYFVIPPVFYKHAAPLGLKTSPLLTFPLSHFLVFLCVLALNIPPIFNPANPLILNILIQTTFPHCTPLECCSWTNRPSIDITLRWSEKQSRFPASSSGAKGYFVIPPIYKHAAPLGLKTSPLLPFSPSPLPTFPLSHHIALRWSAVLGPIVLLETLRSAVLLCNPAPSLPRPFWG